MRRLKNSYVCQFPSKKIFKNINKEMKTYEVKFYRSKFLKKWRWTIKADNGNIIGASTQGYWNKLDCVDNATLVGQCLLQNKDLSK